MKKTIIAAAIMALSGCTVLADRLAQNSGSYVAQAVSLHEYEEIAKDMASFLAEQLPSAKTTLAMAASRSEFHGMLINRLAEKGFGIMDTKAVSEDVIPFSYFVTTLDGGILVRMKYKEQVAGRYYPRTEQGLSFNNKYAVREVSK